MFSRTVAFLSCTLALSTLAAATPAGLGDLGLGNLGNLGGQGGQGGYPPVTTTVTAPGSGATAGSQGKCSTGALQCCNQTQKATDPAISNMLALLGIVVQGVDALVGVNCSPISVIGVATANQCNAEAVCCDNNNIGGLISLGCVPVTL